MAATIERNPATLNAEVAGQARAEVEHMLRLDAVNKRRKEGHELAMRRAFGDLRNPRRAAKQRRHDAVREAKQARWTYPDWLADLLHDESMAAPDLTLPVDPEPTPGEFIWGASLTCIPERSSGFLLEIDPDLLGAVDAAVREAMEVFGDEHLSAQDLADVTGWPLSSVTGAMNRAGVRRKRQPAAPEEVACPGCGAAPGARCVTTSGIAYNTRTKRWHVAREEAARHRA